MLYNINSSQKQIDRLLLNILLYIFSSMYCLVQEKKSVLENLIQWGSSEEA